MTSLGHIDPAIRPPDGSPIDPHAPARPDVLRTLHADLVRAKGRRLAISAPFVVLAIAAIGIGIAFPASLGILIYVGVVGVGAFAQEAYEWFTLRRANPLTSTAQDAQGAAARLAFERVDLTRAQARQGAVTLALFGLIALVTIVEFVQAVRTSFPAVIKAAALVKPAVRAGAWWRLLTATFLHGNLQHLLANLGTLVVLGRIVEKYEGRMRVPLVYLVAAVAGSVCSVLLSTRTSLGASGGILGLAGYLVVAAGRSDAGAPRLIRARIMPVLAAMAVMGAAIAFVDNAGHLGGVLGGAAVGLALPRGDARRERLVTVLGTIASVVLAAGAALTIWLLLV